MSGNDNNIPKGWMECTLGDVSNVTTGFPFKSKKYSDTGTLRVVRGENVSLKRLRWDNTRFWNHSTDKLEQYLLDENDIVIGMDGSRIGKNKSSIPSSDLPLILAQRVARVKARGSVYQGFLKYTILNNRFERYIIKVQTGTSIPHISLDLIRDYEIIIPENPQEQQAIAHILTTFDDKIELLQAQNQTLEATAQTIFKEWFGKYQIGDELPEGWRVGKLGDEFDILMGQSPKGTSYNTEGNGSIFFQGRAEFTERFPDIRLFTTEPKRMADKFDVLVSVRAPVGDINVALDKCCIGRGLAAVNSIYKSYCLYKLKSLKPVFDLFESEGTVFGSINKASFSNIEVVIPIEAYKKELDDLLFNLDLKIMSNKLQIQTLQQTRDTLLPKLMSGKLRVDEFK